MNYNFNGMNQDIPKRKRGRPPKVHAPIALDVGFPSSHLPESAVRGVQHGYKILKEILAIPKIKALLEEPDDSLFGLHDYYDVIDTPIWFLEISRKFTSKEYIDLNDIINDMRLVLENCYRFWGPKHKFVKQAFRVEKLLEKQIKEFPEYVSGDSTEGESASSHNQCSSENESPFLLEEYNSKILLQMDKNPTKPKVGALSEEELRKWEGEVLMSKHQAKQILSMPELAEIGHFLKLARDVLCLKELTQYEVERMLLMSKESSTLASIMTCFLCPTAMRGTLYFKPIMTYNVWANLLSKKLDNWYNAFYKCHNRIQLFVKHGIDPSFWEIIGPSNPLNETDFQDLSFIKKATILKALCTSIFHSNKKIEEHFNTVDESSLRIEAIFEDSKYEYFHLFLPEIRIYRIPKAMIDAEEIMNSVFSSYYIFSAPEEDDDISSGAKYSGRQKFCLISSDRESCSSLSKVFSKKRKSVKTISWILSQEDNANKTLIGLRALYSQWKRTRERNSNFFDNSFNYWINKASTGVNGIVDGELEVSVFKDSNGVPANETAALGKRILKKKFSVEDVGSSSNEDEKNSEGSVSDWEDGNVRRSKRIKKASKTLPRFFDRRFMSQFELGKEFRTCLGLKEDPIQIPIGRGIRIQRTTPIRRKLCIVSTALSNSEPFLGTPEQQDPLQVLTIDMGKKETGSTPDSKNLHLWSPTQTRSNNLWESLTHPLHPPLAIPFRNSTETNVVNENGLSLLELSPYKPQMSQIMQNLSPQPKPFENRVTSEPSVFSAVHPSFPQAQYEQLKPTHILNPLDLPSVFKDSNESKQFQNL